MTDKEKIREEVKRLYNQSLADENRQADRGLERAANVSYGKSEACKELLSFIDSMQEEPTTSVWHDKSEKPKMNSIIVMNNNQTTLSVEYVGQSLCGVERWAYIDNLLKL